MFGVIDTVSTFNRASAIFHTVEQFNKKTVSILKEEKGKYSNQTSAFKEEDIKTLNQKFPDIKLKRIVGADINFGGSYWGGNSYSKTINIAGLENQSINPSKQPYHSGMTHVTDSEMDKLGLTILAGRLPTADNEYAISKHIVDAFKSINSSANISYETMLTTYKEFSLGNNSEIGIIVGVIDDGSDYSEYMNMDISKIREDNMLQQKTYRELEFGFGNMLYITENKYNELLAKPINMQLNIVHDNSSSSFNLNELS
jgi:hypothetical protein